MRLPYFAWRDGVGLSRGAPGTRPPVPGTESLLGCLKHIASAEVDALYRLKGVDTHYGDAALVGRLVALAERFSHGVSALLVSDPEPHLPAPLATLATFVKLAPPTPNEYYDYLRALVRDVGSRIPLSVTLGTDDMRQLLALVQGLTYLELKKVMTQAMLDDGVLDRSVLDSVRDAKRAVVERTGVLEYFPTGERLEDVAGLSTLKRWLEQRAVAFLDPPRAREFGLCPPRGILLLGVQGCGKSLAARAAAGIFGVPLLRLDFGTLYSKWHGESEKNLRESLAAAEALAPCVLWVDEIEKSLATDSGDSGVSRRVLGTFLTWLAERRSRIFVVATANDISALPPELVRKGRFDEIFFVDLPNRAARVDILAIHARKRNVKLTPRELETLADLSEGFSGAELEQVIVATLYAAHAAGTPVSAALIAQEMRATRPLSVTMAEQVRALRAWARERAVPAD